MKKYLLDTHVLLWWHADNERLSTEVRNIIQNPENNIVVSVVSAWEISIKLKLNKKFNLDFNQANLYSDSFEMLPVDLPHVLELQNLSDIHRDPFDRMLISQAISEDLTLITGDRQIIQYQDIASIKSA